MGLKHPFSSLKPDGSDPSEVNASNWNADHVVTGDVDFGAHKITNLEDPTGAQDGATKHYVDTHGGGGGGFSAVAGAFAAFAVTAAATGNAIVEVTNPGADSAINLVDLGAAPNAGDILVISVLPTSTGGFACVSGGAPSGTKKAFVASSSVAPPGSAVLCFYNGAAWSPLFATPGQLLRVTNSIITDGSISAAGNIAATQLLLGGALRVQACILAGNLGAGSAVDLNSTSEGVVHRLFLNGQTGAGGSIDTITNSAVAPTGGQGLEITNTSPYPVALNGAAGGTGQVILPASLASLMVQPGQTVFCDYDSGNELGFGANVWIVQGWTSSSVAFGSSGGFWGLAGVLLVNEASGNISTAGSVSASGSVGGASLGVNGGGNIYSGAGVPNGTQVGSVGDLYLRTGGGAGTTLYVKESGAATNMGWVGK